MCGLVGAFGRTTKQILDVFEDMLWADAIRGDQSTGVAFVSPARANISKEIGPPPALFNTKGYNKNFNRHQNSALCLLGHNRFATRGSVVRENAHPFQHGHIILAHNGTLRNMDRIKEYDKYGTDSEAICAAFATEGVENAYKKLNGAMALTWYDLKEKSFNILVNSERPLFFGMTPDNKTLLWSSESWILSGCAARRNLTLNSPILYPEKHRLCSFKIKENEEIHMNIKKVKEWEWTAPASTGQYSNLPIRASHMQAELGFPKHSLEPGLDNIETVAEYEAWQLEGRQRKERELSVVGKKENRQISIGITHRMQFVDFLKHYSRCIFCDEKYTDIGGAVPFDDAIIIDAKSSACQECASVALETQMRS